MEKKSVVRVLIMEKQGFLILKTLLVLVVISEASVLRNERYSGPEDENVPTAVLGKDKILTPIPGVRNPGRDNGGSSGVEYANRGVNNPRRQPPDYDDGIPDEIDMSKPGINPEIIPEYEAGDANRDKPTKSGDGENFEPFDEELPDKAIGGEEEESKPSPDEDEEKVLEEDNDEGKNAPEGEGDKEEPDDKNDEKPSEEESGNEKPNEEESGNEKPSDEEPDDDKPIDEKPNVGTDENDKEPGEYDEDNQGEDDSDFGGSIFDTPFFNLNKVRKYFNQMERALGQVFRQTLQEARLLNGTYANTTEEEVEIGGRKYIVQKSIIKGADNNSALYVEALSTKPKL